MKFLKAILLIFLAFTFSSCGTGPEGPQGPPGNANVYSSTIEILEEDFVAEDEFVSVAEYGWNELDELTVDEGLVIGYLRYEGTTAWHSLPLSIPFENDLVVLRYQFDIDSFNLIIEGEIADNNDVNEEIFDGDILRVVAIPPSQMFKAKGVDYNNYEQVARLYGLED